jgi:N-terminal 7TM region of histidine kinase
MNPSVFWPTTLQAAALFTSTALSIWAVVISRTRRGVPGSAAFSWLMIAISVWSFTSALHTLASDTGTRIVIAKVQYLGVAPIGVLWLLFISHYSRAAWPSNRWLHGALWVVPVITLGLAATNELHDAYWTAITEVATPSGTRLVYTGGVWYWLHAGYSYVLMGAGTWILARGLRRFPPPYRRQTVLMAVGAIVPWISNILYLSRALPATGLDLTPIGFTVSGACFTWALYRYRLFGLVPVARDR